MAHSPAESKSQFAGRATVALLEECPSELNALLLNQGAVPIAVPAVTQALYLELEEVRRLVDDLSAGRYEVALFMSGDAVLSLLECAQEVGRRRELVSALRTITLACRGPKATASLRRFGLHVNSEILAPLTTGSLTRFLQQLELSSRGVLRFNGEPHDLLAKSLAAQHANLREVSLTQRRSAQDTAAAEELVHLIVGGAVQALVVSCEIQFLHLYLVARKLELARELIYALRRKVTVAVVGASARDVLEAHGVHPHPMPAQPQMLSMALLHFLDMRAATPREPRNSSALPS